MQTEVAKKTEMISEKEYRAYNAINYSALADFHRSQDHALLTRESKSYFQIGHVFEDMLRDATTGTTLFEERYFVADVDGKMPDQLIGWLDAGDDLEQYIKFNQNGSRSKTHAVKHAYIDACRDNPGKLPIGKTDYQMLLRLRDNMLIMELLGATVFEVLKQCKWQVPVIWEEKGLTKKALYDCVLNLDDETYCFDVKSAANEIGFNKFANNKYWIQSEHYSEGAEKEWGNVQGFYFLIAYKELPFLCEPVQISGDYSYEYNELCMNYMKWLKAGKPPKGYLPFRKFYKRTY